MRLATITNWAYGATVSLTVASAISMLLASNAQDRERVATAQRYILDKASTSIAEDVTALSDQAREFVVTGNPDHLSEYQREVAQLKSVEDRLAHIKDVGAQADELSAIADAMRRADGLLDEQQDAVTRRQKDDEDNARRILFGPDYDRELERIDSDIERFQYRLDQRANADLSAAISVSRIWKLSSEIVLTLTGLLFLGVLYFVFKKRVLRPVIRLSDIVNRLAAQDYAVEPPAHDEIDEIGDLSQALRLFRTNTLEKQRLEQERHVESARQALLSRMTQRMQECDTLHQLEQVIESFIPEILPAYSGRLFIFDEVLKALIEKGAWRGLVHTTNQFCISDCWALKRGAMHRSNGTEVDVPCEHLKPWDKSLDSICLPLTSRQGVLGLLYLECATLPEPQSSSNDVYLKSLADSIGLSLGNLRLREQLRKLALLDPLTGLANRRSLDEVMGERVAEAERTGQSISCLMIDIDHFKKFNDAFGHEAGDVVLRQVASVLKQASREADLAARFGGEEFLILSPNLNSQAAQLRAEEVRRKIMALRLESNGRDLGAISVSIGVATAPEHCSYPTLAKTADAVLYRAKASGRNCVVTAEARVTA